MKDKIIEIVRVIVVMGSIAMGFHALPNGDAYNINSITDEIKFAWQCFTILLGSGVMGLIITTIIDAKLGKKKTKEI